MMQIWTMARMHAADIDTQTTSSPSPDKRALLSGMLLFPRQSLHHRNVREALDERVSGISTAKAEYSNTCRVLVKRRKTRLSSRRNWRS
jgi:hypothetical protein